MNPHPPDPSSAHRRLLIVDEIAYDSARAIAGNISCLVISWAPELGAWLGAWASEAPERRVVSVSVQADADALAVRERLPSPVRVWRGSPPSVASADTSTVDGPIVALMKGRGEMLLLPVS